MIKAAKLAINRCRGFDALIMTPADYRRLANVLGLFFYLQT
jgi:hypothetical protein